MHQLSYDDVTAAADRIASRIRPVALTRLDPGSVRTSGLDGSGLDDSEACQVWLALEYMQHTGSFKARGAQNFLAAHREAGTLPDAGVTIASGGNAGLACAWAAGQQGVRATVFLPENAPLLKVARLRAYGADVRLVGSEYAEALHACEDFATTTGALASHAYADPLISAGAGTVLDEIREQIPDLGSVVVAVGGGGLFAGVATAGAHHGVHTVAVEPESCRALNAALETGHLVDVTVDSVAADSLGARRTWSGALAAAQSDLARSVLVTDGQIIAARQALWDHRRIVVEHGTAAALAALLAPDTHPAQLQQVAADRTAMPTRSYRSYRPGPREKVAVLLCGANTNPADLTRNADLRREHSAISGS